MIAALHGLIAPANVTKGYADHEFVIGSLNDLSARSTCPMTAASSRRQHNRSPYIKYNFFPFPSNLHGSAEINEAKKITYIDHFIIDILKKIK